jgi:hypothetical protein
MYKILGGKITFNWVTFANALFLCGLNFKYDILNKQIIIIIFDKN